MGHKNNPFKNPDSIEEEAKQENLKDENEIKQDDNELQKKYDELNQQYIRLAADFDNYRKRQEHEREELLKFGAENALKKMLDVLDNFERGKKTLENIDDCSKVKESFDLVHKQVIEVLKKMGLEEIETEGKEFDPNTESKTVKYTEIPDGWEGFDIGQATIDMYSKELQNAKTVIWNGPVGLFEFDQFAIGTNSIAKALADVDAVKIVFESKVKLTIIPCENVASNLVTSVYELNHHLKRYLKIMISR